MSGTFTSLHGPGREQFPPALGQTTSNGSLSVVIASDQTPIPVTAGSSVNNLSTVARYDYLAVPVGAGAYVQILASTANAINHFYIFDSSGMVMIFAVGGVGVEVPVAYIPPGGSPGILNINIPAASRISVKCLTTNQGNSAASGDLVFVGYP